MHIPESCWVGISEILEGACIILDSGHFAGGHHGDQSVLACEGGVEVAHVENVR